MIDCSSVLYGMGAVFEEDPFENWHHSESDLKIIPTLGYFLLQPCPIII